VLTDFIKNRESSLSGSNYEHLSVKEMDDLAIDVVFYFAGYIALAAFSGFAAASFLSC
jgi:hypothetical protein